ncbi:unnamed protein product [Prorocentrum cordatum]|uniref:Secreted protein n=1 Tax=Prorocentrum cordatum TaxID=2364126 RepID=A0ABN9Y325_9DINO|nr:unnamed protein product [Polarella glacialis]
MISCTHYFLFAYLPLSCTHASGMGSLERIFARNWASGLLARYGPVHHISVEAEDFDCFLHMFLVHSTCASAPRAARVSRRSSVVAEVGSGLAPPLWDGFLSRGAFHT